MDKSFLVLFYKKEQTSSLEEGSKKLLRI